MPSKLSGVCHVNTPEKPVFSYQALAQLTKWQTVSIAKFEKRLVTSGVGEPCEQGVVLKWPKAIEVRPGSLNPIIGKLVALPTPAPFKLR
jgi:hypothetical protein